MKTFFVFHILYLVHAFTILNLFITDDITLISADGAIAECQELSSIYSEDEGDSMACFLFEIRYKIKSLSLKTFNIQHPEFSENQQWLSDLIILTPKHFDFTPSTGDDAYRRYLNLRVLII
ncbi:MAG: hypothetical protein IPP77_14330 [Bacteroidetes bacterium]|nr:hypothetical protein [Bacteroidota bacterium]